jgi:hypothetical protein
VMHVLGAQVGKPHLDGDGLWSLIFRPTASDLGLAGWLEALEMPANSMVLLNPAAAHWGTAQESGHQASIQVNACLCGFV